MQDLRALKKQQPEQKQDKKSEKKKRKGFLFNFNWRKKKEKEVISKIGYTTQSGRNNETVKARLQKFQIDISYL